MAVKWWFIAWLFWGIMLPLAVFARNSDEAINDFHQLTTPAKAIAILGYDPAIEFISSDVNGTITLYFHGWNRNKEDIKERLYYKKPAIFFNFRDAATDRKAPLRWLSLGQLPDIKPALFILQAIAATHLTDTINLVGFSRGATVIVNLIGILNNPASYKNELAALGITEQLRVMIVTMIERGVILLDCPLKKIYPGIHCKVSYKRSQILKAPFTRTSDSLCRSCFCQIAHGILQSLDCCCTLFLQYLYLPLCTEYKPWREEAFSSLDHWQGLKLTTIIRYDQEDPFVSNYGDYLFFEKICQLNPQHTHLLISEHLGHCSPFRPLADLFNKLTTP